MSPHGRTRTDATLSRRRRRMHTMASQRTTTAHPSAPHALSGSQRTIGRRQVLGASGAGAVALALAACTGGGQSAREASEAPVGDGTLQWWDQFRPLTGTFEDELFDPFMSENSEITIERQQLDAQDLGQACRSLAAAPSCPMSTPSQVWTVHPPPC